MPGGLLAFTVETHDGDGVILGEGLRYAHGAGCVRAAIECGRPQTVAVRGPVGPQRGQRAGARPGRGRASRSPERSNPGIACGWHGPGFRPRHPLRGATQDQGPRRNGHRGLPCAVPPSRILSASSAETAALLPDRFRDGSRAAAGRRASTSSALLAKARDDRSALLIAPTGAGKTLAGFLPTLVELSARRGGRGTRAADVISTGRGVQRSRGLHTLYISPLKALAVDIARNLETPVAEMACRSRSRPAPATRRCRGGSGSGAIRRTSCSPRRSNSRCCCRPTTRRSCSRR